MGEVARNITKINTTLEDHQVEFEGKVFDRSISILIDPGATLSYITPKIVE